MPISLLIFFGFLAWVFVRVRISSKILMTVLDNLYRSQPTEDAYEILSLVEGENLYLTMVFGFWKTPSAWLPEKVGAYYKGVSS